VSLNDAGELTATSLVAQPILRSAIRALDRLSELGEPVDAGLRDAVAALEAAPARDVVLDVRDSDGRNCVVSIIVRDQLGRVYPSRGRTRRRRVVSRSGARPEVGAGSVSVFRSGYRMHCTSVPSVFSDNQGSYATPSTNQRLPLGTE